MLPQQQQPVASIGSGWPYGTKRPSYSKGTNVFLPGTQNRSGAIIPSTAVLMLCHPSSAPDKTMLTVFDGLDVAAEYKNLVRAGAPDVEAALPWDKPPGTLYLHLAQGEEFTSSKGQCSKCKVQTKAGSLVWFALVVCKHKMGAGIHQQSSISPWLKVYCSPACAAEACSKGDGMVDPCTPLPRAWPYSGPVQAAAGGAGGAGAGAGAGLTVCLTRSMEDRVLVMHSRLEEHQQQHVGALVVPKLPLMEHAEESGGLHRGAIQQLRKWKADDGRRGPKGQVLGEGLVLTPELVLLLEGCE